MHINNPKKIEEIVCKGVELVQKLDAIKGLSAWERQRVMTAYWQGQKAIPFSSNVYLPPEPPLDRFIKWLGSL